MSDDLDKSSVHVAVWSDRGYFGGFVAYCLHPDCRWTCAGYPPAVKEAARQHGLSSPGTVTS